MEYVSSSHGIVSNPQIAKLLTTNKIRRLPFYFQRPSLKNSTIIGWGYKPNTVKSRAFALDFGLDYWALEDGFIGWLNHPSTSKPSERLSYIVDKKGIYYDASAPSGIDEVLTPLDPTSENRIERLRSQLIKLGVSKYNQPRAAFPKWLLSLKNHEQLAPVLMVDQTFNDASIECSGGSSESFDAMLAWGLGKLQQDLQACLIIKVHPDVILGKKKGYLFERVKPYLVGRFANRIHFLSDDVSPSELIAMSTEVATVSSQLGFEALWQNKKVTCFAWPFYAGRGLTCDLSPESLSYERQSASLNELMFAALIIYPVYLHPDTQQRCEVEDILNYLQAHFLSRQLLVDHLYVPNVSLWKRSFIPEFLSESVKSISYKHSQAVGHSTELIWGMKDQAIEDRDSRSNIWRMEDGFIRSVGLGADLRRPSSLVLDDQGIYYNGKQPSRLESLLNEYDLSTYETHRGSELVKQMVNSSVTKYNVDAQSDVSKYLQKANGKDIILVVGQFQKDLSMQFGAVDYNDNLGLLEKTRIDFPDAYIIFKEHPDVYSGVRPGKLSEADVLAFADEYLTDTGLLSLFSITDRVSTICSLTGFEALLRGIKVSTYGLPFYAGWGLTDDHYAFSRRTRQRSIEELVYISLVLYARYVDWGTRQLTSPESVISAIELQAVGSKPLKSSWLSRQGRKLVYLSQSLLKPPKPLRKRAG